MLSKAAPNPAFASFKGAADAYAAMRVGCFKDDKFQDIGTVVEKTRENEPARCLAKCRSGGFKYAGLQGERCSCGNSYGHWGPEPAGCNEPCPGQPAYACGGANRNTVLATGTIGAAGAGCYLQTGTIGKGGCPKQPRGFTAEIWWNKEDDASQQKCLAQAKEVRATCLQQRWDCHGYRACATESFRPHQRRLAAAALQPLVLTWLSCSCALLQQDVAATQNHWPYRRAQPVCASASARTADGGR